MNIGEASKATGVSAKMIRYYEQIGLIPKAIRSEAGYRSYGDSDVHSLRFIRRARDLGFPVEQITQLLALWRDRSRASAKVKSVAQKHIADLQARIADLQAMSQTLEHLVAHCHGDDRPECPIIQDLADEEAAAKSSGKRKDRPLSTRLKHRAVKRVAEGTRTRPGVR